MRRNIGMKKILVLGLAAILVLGTFAACGKASGKVYVVSREDGSGTRSAFEELFEVEETIASAEKTNSTAVMMMTVAEDSSAIGYISLGSLNDTVRALSIDSVIPSTATAKDGSYPITRPFNVVTNGTLSPQAQEFLDFIRSKEGNDVIEAYGCIRLEGAQPFTGAEASGKVVVAGSSSVSPLMEKLQEAYKKVNPNVTVEIQTSDSSTGINAAIEGVCDIGMASRALKDSEREKGVAEAQIAMDAIVVIVNKENSVNNLSKNQVRNIYTGEITAWVDI
jgi:phosphate transport system substrate-binding protein